mgnify:CR=1 FL=1
MVDIGTLSLILLLGMFALLAIGMPLGFDVDAKVRPQYSVWHLWPRSAVGVGASGISADDKLCSDFDTAFHLYGRVAGKVGHCARYVFVAERLAFTYTRRHRFRHVDHGGNHGRHVRYHRRRGRLAGADSTTSDAASGVRQKLGDRYDLRIRFIGNHDPALNCVDLLWIGDGNLDQGAVYSLFSAGVHVGDVLFAIYIRTHPIEPSIGTFTRPGSG